MLSSVQDALSPYVTSYFSKHGLLANLNIPSRIIGGVVLFPVSKIIDFRGRTEGFIGSVFLIVVGMVMKAACQNVETYVAAQVFYWVGKAALGFVLDVFVADITTLRNRTIILTLNSTPILVTTFAGPEIAQLFYTYSNFRWAFGAWAIILLGFAVPIIAILFFQERKAAKAGIVRKESGRTLVQSANYYFMHFDGSCRDLYLELLRIYSRFNSDWHGLDLSWIHSFSSAIQFGVIFQGRLDKCSHYRYDCPGLGLPRCIPRVGKVLDTYPILPI